ncbi:MAG: hypothetical protein R6U32_06275 [Candidatus Woesearchaeota archaeon]
MEDKYAASGDFTIDLPEGGGDVVIKADDMSTMGRDYYRKARITTDTKVYMFPAGTLTGMVKDKLDNVVSNAELKFECSNDIGYEFPESADKFGSFSVDFAPVGECRVFASHRDSMGVQNVKVEQGSIVDTEITLNGSIVPYKAEDSGWPKIIFLSIVIFALLAFLITGLKMYAGEGDVRPRSNTHARKKKKTESPSSNKDGGEGARNKRATDIMKTLNEKDRLVVDYLLGSQNKAVQSRIRHDLGIPRTTLSRVLVSLEKKNIIGCEKHGKAVKVWLTDWFLGKD